MTNEQFINNLVVLVADKNMKFAVEGVLSRVEALGIRKVAYNIYVHPERDPGCLLRGHLFLSPFIKKYSHALVMLDLEGSGREEYSREILECEIEKELSKSGWDNRAAAIIIYPELETWVWSDSPHVDSVLGWQGRHPDLREWLRNCGFLGEGQIKPIRPKEAVEEVLRVVRKPRSSRLYMLLAQKVSLNDCVDQAFLKLKTKLQEWFPAE